jgi:hypothetical protein
VGDIMSEMIEKRRNGAMWLGFLLALAAVLCNFVLVLSGNLPGNRAVPWLSLLLAVLGSIFLAVGLWRTYLRATAGLSRGNAKFEGVFGFTAFGLRGNLRLLTHPNTSVLEGSAAGRPKSA